MSSKRLIEDLDKGGEDKEGEGKDEKGPGYDGSKMIILSDSSFDSLPRTDKTFKFNRFCEILEVLSTTKKRKRREQLGCLTRQLWMVVKDGDFFPFLRLLLPDLDVDRGNFRVKESTLGKIFVTILGLPVQGEEAEHLKKWATHKGSGMFSPYFSDYIHELLMRKNYSSAPSSLASRSSSASSIHSSALSVADVNDTLNKFAHAKTLIQRSEILFSVVENAGPLEIKWLVRILLKDMRLSMGSKGILQSLHPSAEILYNHCTDLKTVCVKCRDPRFRVDIESGSAIQYGKPIRPMLAKVAPPKTQFSRLLKERKWSVETKFDGERVMIHLMGASGIKYVSRNGIDVSHNFAMEFDLVIRQYVMASKCILDGEMLVWDDDMDDFMAFGTSRSHSVDIRRQMVMGREKSSRHFCYVVFDVIAFEDDTTIMQWPLSQRREILRKTIVPQDATHRLELAKWELPQRLGGRFDVSEIYHMLDVAIDEGKEGIMLKDIESPYIPADRNRGNWIKVKPDYIDGIGDDLDLIVMGGYHGTKLGKSSLSHFLLGLRVEDAATTSAQWIKSKSSGSVKTKIRPFCKVGGGCSHADLEEVQDRLKRRWVEWGVDQSRMKNLFGNWHPSPSEAPNVYIDPDDSLVFQIKATQIIDCSTHPKYMFPFSLRFPRFICIREDKSAEDVTSDREVRALYQRSQQGTLHGKRERASTQASDDFTGNLANDGHYDDGDGGGGDDDDDDDDDDDFGMNGDESESGRTVRRMKRSSQREGRLTGERSGSVLTRGRSTGIHEVLHSLIETSEANSVQRSSMFEDMGRIVLLINDEKTKRSLRRLITEHGGHMTPHVGPDTHVAVAKDAHHFMVQEIIRHGNGNVSSQSSAARERPTRASTRRTKKKREIIHSVDVLRVAYFEDCVKEGRLLVPVAKYVIHLSEDTRERLREQLDPNLDAYTVDVTPDEVKEIISTVQPSGNEEGVEEVLEAAKTVLSHSYALKRSVNVNSALMDASPSATLSQHVSVRRATWFCLFMPTSGEEVNESIDGDEDRVKNALEQSSPSMRSCALILRSIAQRDPSSELIFITSMGKLHNVFGQSTTEDDEPYIILIMDVLPFQSIRQQWLESHQSVNVEWRKARDFVHKWHEENHRFLE